MTTACTLGLDLGTSSAKAVVTDTGGRVLSQASAGYAVTSAMAGYAESEPADWWSAVTGCAREAVGAAGGAPPVAIGLSGQMHGLVLASADGGALRPALLWADSRATGALRAYRRLGPGALARLANPLAPGMTGPLLKWVAENEPGTYRDARWALQPKDWLRARLTGEVHAEPSDASASLLYDVPGDRWDLEVVSALGLEAGLLAPLLPSAGAPAGHLTAGAAAELGLPAGLPVAAGAADTAAAALGSGIGPGDIQLTVGTGAQVIRPLTAPVSRADAGINLYRSATPDGWYHMGATVSAGLSLNWVREVMHASWAELYASAERPGQAHDPIFVPHLSGERTPYSDPALRGSWTALSLADDRTSLLRGALEGTAFAIRDALDALLGQASPGAAAAGRRGHPGRGLAAAARRRARAAAVRRGRARGLRPGRRPAGRPRRRPAELRRHPGTAGAARPAGGRTGPGHGRPPRGTARQVPARRLGPARGPGWRGRDSMTVLTGNTLAELNVPVPGYDRRQVTTGIVHIGVGGFHRSHQAMYIDTLMNGGAAMDWGICGIGLQPSNVRMRDVLAAQDGLYTLVLRHSDGTWDARVIGSIVEYLFAPDDPEAAIEKMAAPGTRIVSLTVTEGGYNLDAVTGEFNASDPSVVADLRPGAAPHTVFGLVTEALARRRDRGIPAFSILSCDNIQGNGQVSQRAFTAFARLRDPGLASWITSHVRFPNCMVDRITPQTTEADRAELSRRFGLDDQWPVLCEPFTQWVLEDSFSAGRPPLEDVGVQIVSDVEPYELMKLRLLNASHQALCYPGYLTGYRLVHDVTTDPLFAGFLLDYMTAEAIPTLRPVPGIDLHQYARQLIERFSNPEVRDTVARLCANTSDLIPKFLLPVIRAPARGRRPVHPLGGRRGQLGPLRRGHRRERRDVRAGRRPRAATARRGATAAPPPHRLPRGQPRGLRRAGRRPPVHRGVPRDPDLPARPGRPEDLR